MTGNPEPRPLTIGLDIDNVLYPWSEVFTRYAEQWDGLPLGSLNDEAGSWHWYRDEWGWDTEKFLACYRAGVREGIIFTKGDPRPGALHTAHLLDAAGHRIEYVSDRVVLPALDSSDTGVSAGVARLRTYDWLHRWGFPQRWNLTISADKAVVHSDVFLDDKPENVEALRAAGHPLPVLYVRRHNERYPWRHRVESWEAFRLLVKTRQEHLAWLRTAA